MDDQTFSTAVEPKDELFLQSNTKRSRDDDDSASPALAAKDIVVQIQQALTTKQRLVILHTLQLYIQSASIDPSKTVHALIEAGCFSALVLQLGFVLQRSSTCASELEQLCTAMGLLIGHCTSAELETVVVECGPNLWELLATALQWGIQWPVVSIIHTCSSSPAGTLATIRSRRLLLRLVQILGDEETHNATLLEVLGCFKNLTYYGDDQRSVLLEIPGLVAALAAVLQTHKHYNDKVLERLSATWRNLSLSPSLRPSLAQEPDVLTCLLDLVASSHRHNNPNVRRNVLQTLVSLAMDSESCVIMVLYNDGILLQTMKRLLSQQEPDAVVRKRAARTLRLLANEPSAPIIIHDTNLMDHLSHTALYDEDQNVRTEAAQAFGRCANLLEAPMPQHEAMLEALEHLVVTAVDRHIPESVLARIIKEQTAHAGNRVAIAQRDKLLIALARIGVSTEALNIAKDDVCSTLLDLATEPENRERLAMPVILQVLVENVLESGARMSRREHAVQTLIHLSSVQANREKMVNHGNLLQSLIHFAATATGDETKDQVKNVILTLVREL